MKKIKYITILGIILMIFTYLLGVLSYGSFSPSNWSEASNLFFTLMEALFFVGAGISISMEIDKL